ncbi:unnamed protein product [Cylicocyclus nassatus]|uniref:Uncharacterized protein n=1 Tax=Cylicocyclus nassatus TaxID=53992 RepID=A0AA36DM04_CYLNA|nr:unnamed protein product [Cylicocyclus nassatus]
MLISAAIAIVIATAVSSPVVGQDGPEQCQIFRTREDVELNREILTAVESTIYARNLEFCCSCASDRSSGTGHWISRRVGMSYAEVDDIVDQIRNALITAFNRRKKLLFACKNRDRPVTVCRISSCISQKIACNLREI